MSTSLKTFFPLALLAAFALVGCDSKSSDEAASPPAANIEAVDQQAVTVETATEPEAAATAESDDAEQPEGKKLNKGQQMAEQMRAMLKPEIIGPALDENIAKIQETFAGITDKESAAEALPKLNGFLDAIKRINAVAPLIPADTKPIIVEKLAAASEPMKESIASLNENEEIAEVLSPVLEGIANYSEILKNRFTVAPAEGEDSETEADADADQPEESSDAAPEE